MQRSSLHRSTITATIDRQIFGRSRSGAAGQQEVFDELRKIKLNHCARLLADRKKRENVSGLCLKQNCDLTTNGRTRTCRDDRNFAKAATNGRDFPRARFSIQIFIRWGFIFCAILSSAQTDQRRRIYEQQIWMTTICCWNPFGRKLMNELLSDASVCLYRQEQYIGQSLLVREFLTILRINLESRVIVAEWRKHGNKIPIYAPSE